MKKKVVILYPEIKEKDNEDVIDTIEQVRLVEKALEKLNYEVHLLECTLNLLEISKSLIQIKPDFCFNLVEHFNNDGKMICLVPMLLENHDISYTSPDSKNMFITTNKVLCKELLISYKLKTPPFIYNNKIYGDIHFPQRFIIKPVYSDGSLFIDEDNIMIFSSLNECQKAINNFNERYKKDFFAEIYIDGREFNVSLLCYKNRCEIFPLAEIIFKDYPENKPKILSYNAKWVEHSFEYKNTIRNFNFLEKDKPLLEKIKDICQKSYENFNLRGYVRIDIRVDKEDNIYIIEININPSLGKDAGYVAAANEYGLSFEELIKKIIETI